ncbi:MULTISPECIES: LOG family protein [Methylomonas]|uniref:LOG family protein n=1 Tax=Methylomonas TaxID=416 RepID=UPI001231A970|nr:TIGR00730 family Rossman fold protein [Methylomonas rhizoryzae]
MRIKSLCVYCGSSPGRNGDYLAAAEALAEEMVGRGIRLVYGGADVGVMGAVANAVLAAGGQVTGIIPEALVSKEVAHRNLTELHVTRSMHDRKAMMAELADAFVALPGGIGTLEEIFEIWTWAQLGLHQKPFGLLNVAGYYDKLIAFLDHVVEERFVKPPHRQALLVASAAAQLLDGFETYHPAEEPRWMTSEQI